MSDLRQQSNTSSLNLRNNLNITENLPENLPENPSKPKLYLNHKFNPFSNSMEALKSFNYDKITFKPAKFNQKQSRKRSPTNESPFMNLLQKKHSKIKNSNKQQLSIKRKVFKPQHCPIIKQ